MNLLMRQWWARLLAGLAALCLLGGQFGPMPAMGPILLQTVPMRVFETSSTPGSFQSSIANFTFTSQPLGPAAADRTIIVAASLRCVGASTTITAVSVAGNGASLVKGQASSSTNSSFSSLWDLTLTTGTTGNIVFTLSTTDTCTVSLGVWAAYHLSSNTAVATAGSTGAGSQNLNVNVNAGGLVIASSYGFSASSITWTGVNSDYDVLATSGQQQSGASAMGLAAASPLTVTAAIPSNTAGEASGVSASFR